MGYEAAGTVDAVGEGVQSVAPGDFVVLNWRAVCGQCRACKRGQQLGVDLYAPMLLQPCEDPLWKMSYPDHPYWSMTGQQRIGVAGTVIEVLHTPGHSPGSVCLHLPEADALFSGDTLGAEAPSLEDWIARGY